MANGNGNGNSINWRLAGGIGGVASIVLAFNLNTAKDAQIALNVVEQHGQEILMVNQKLEDLRNEVRDRTRERYTSKDAERDFRFLDERLKRCERALEEIDD